MFKRLAILSVTLLLSTTVGAQDSERTDAAREEYSLAADAFGAGRFQEALDHFSRAYEYSPRGELLYNIGTAHDRLGHPASALRFYYDYLEAIPDAGNRDYAEARMAVLERQVAEEVAEEVAEQLAAQDRVREQEAAALSALQAAETLEEVRQEANSNEPSGGANVPAIALISVAGAAAIGALVTGVFALGQRSDLEEACPGMVCTADNQSDLDSLNTLTITTDVLIGVASVAAAVGVVLFIVGGDDDDVSVACGLGGCSGEMRF